MTQQNLKKALTFTEAISLVIGMIIGSGIFLKPGIVFKNAGSPGLGILAWIAGGIITLASALTIAEIASAIPKTGGLYIYLEELYGEIWGFLLGWVQTVIAYPAAIAALAIAFATFSSYFIPLGDLGQKILATCALGFLLLMNIISTRYGGVIQTVSTVGKLLPILVIIVVGLIKGEAHDIHFMQTSIEGAGFGAAILGTLWAYDGWIGVTNVAGELKNPSKELPRAIVLGVGTVIVVYVLVNLAILNVMPALEIIMSQRPASAVASVLLGSGGGAFITIGIMVSVFGAMNGYVMTGSRVPLAMGERNHLPFSNFLKRLHPSFGTPANALMIQFLLSIAYIFSGTFNTLTDLLIFVLWIFFVMGVGGIFILRKRVSKEERNYEVPLYPIVPLIGILGGIYILYSTIVSSPMNSFIGIIITLAGIPIFYYLKKDR
ncbi:APC family permease [Inediibacterium massiliense]|uniref:APC family permease n=1 Tax=Inediibacterium massiliense TaxID=1658111 RepID=UPI0006B54744|nr:amino acid permease [Inediibacterium massiliense]